MPRPNKKFLPVYYLKMASELKKGTPRKTIIEEMAARHGIPKDTAKKYLEKTFPKQQIQSSQDIDRLLWKKRTTIPTPEQRRQIALKRAAKLTPEQRRQIALKIAAAKTPEQRRQIARKREAAKTPEQRRQIALKREAKLTPEQKRQIARKGWEKRRRKSL